MKPEKTWTARLNLMPPPPFKLTVTGTVDVANPGVDAHLRRLEPQGNDEANLQLEVHRVQGSGSWPQSTDSKAVAYIESMAETDTPYTNVEILSNGKRLASIEVEVVR